MGILENVGLKPKAQPKKRGPRRKPMPVSAEVLSSQVNQNLIRRAMNSKKGPVDLEGLGAIALMKVIDPDGKPEELLAYLEIQKDPEFKRQWKEQYLANMPGHRRKRSDKDGDGEAEFYPEDPLDMYLDMKGKIDALVDDERRHQNPGGFESILTSLAPLLTALLQRSPLASGQGGTDGGNHTPAITSPPPQPVLAAPQGEQQADGSGLAASGDAGDIAQNTQQGDGNMGLGDLAGSFVDLFDTSLAPEEAAVAAWDRFVDLMEKKGQLEQFTVTVTLGNLIRLQPRALLEMLAPLADNPRLGSAVRSLSEPWLERFLVRFRVIWDSRGGVEGEGA